MDAKQFAAIAEGVVRDGYAVIPGYLPTAQASALLEDANAILHDEATHSGRHPPGWAESIGVAERSPLFGDLLFDPLLVATYIHAVGPDIELASAGELDAKAPNSPATGCGWHNDFIWMPYVRRPRPFFWLAAYYFLDDISPESGPLWVMPGSHAWPDEPGPEMDNADGCGREIEGSQMITGPAGTVLLVNNEIWHMSPPNVSSAARVMFKVHLKPTWMKPWGHGRAPSSTFIESKTATHEQQLLGAYEYDEVDWQYGRDLDEARFPVLGWLRELPWVPNQLGALSEYH